MTSPQTFYTVRQVASRYGVHRNTVYNWLRSGALQSVKLGASRRITQAALTAFEAGQTGSQCPHFTDLNGGQG